MSVANNLVEILGNHLLEIIEKQLINEAPEITDILINEVHLLIFKMGALINSKKNEVAK